MNHALPSCFRAPSALGGLSVLAFVACGGGSGTPTVTTVAPTPTATSTTTTIATISTSSPATTGTAVTTTPTAAITATPTAVITVTTPVTTTPTASAPAVATNTSAVTTATTATPTNSVTPLIAATSKTFKAQVWADNWFSLYLGDVYMGEDSVPITTERSFNAETLSFSASYPFELNFIIKDYKQNDTGLEYIGLPNQQMGDGGFIMQITDMSTGKIAAVSSTAFKCKVIHKAPLNTACEKTANPTVASCGATILDEPAGWKTSGYNTSTWESATAYTSAQIGVKDGYNTIAWDASAQLIWTSDLKADNTLLCKVKVAG